MARATVCGHAQSERDRYMVQKCGVFVTRAMIFVSKSFGAELLGKKVKLPRTRPGALLFLK